MYFTYEPGFSGTISLSSLEGGMLLVALTKNLRIEGEPLPELYYRTCFGSGETKVSAEAGLGAMILLEIPADCEWFKNSNRPRQGRVPAAAFYFLCALTNGQLAQVHQALARVLLEMMVREESCDTIPPSFLSMQKTYNYVESLGEREYSDPLLPLPVTSKIFRQAVRFLYLKPIKELRRNRTLQTALESLHHSDTGIAMIRDRAGYGDTRSFQKAFKLFFGMTPEVIRRY